jgi:hypothetical protein
MPLTRYRLVSPVRGILVVAGNYAAFISLGVVAAVGMAVCVTAMPETGPKATEKSESAQAGGLPQMGETGR